MRPRVSAMVAILVFLAAILPRPLYRSLLPAPWGGLLWQAGFVVLAFLGLFLAHRLGPRRALPELGLDGSIASGLGVAALGVLPMALILALGSGRAVLDADRLLRGALVAGFVEEFLFRGYLFRQLHRRGAWPWPLAAAASGLLFGLAHVPATAGLGDLGAILGVVAVTTTGGVWFAWLLMRWDGNLWLPIGLHVFMNASWEIFADEASAAGGMIANLARAGTIALVTILTLRRRRASDPSAVTCEAQEME